MTITLVAAIARNGVIGADGGIPWHLPGEQRSFKETTLGHVLVMGRLTYDSIGRPLPGRTTIVVTSRPDWRPDVVAAETVRVARSVEDALRQGLETDDEVFVVGGERVYAEALPLADRLQLTWVDAEPAGDAYFPSVEWQHWQEVDHEHHDGWDRVTYQRVD